MIGKIADNKENNEFYKDLLMKILNEMAEIKNGLDILADKEKEKAELYGCYDKDELYESAVEVVRGAGKASVSLF